MDRAVKVVNRAVKVVDRTVKVVDRTAKVTERKAEATERKAKATERSQNNGRKAKTWIERSKSWIDRQNVDRTATPPATSPDNPPLSPKFYSRLKHNNNSCEKCQLCLKNVDLSHTAINLKSYKYVDLPLFRKTLH